VHDSVSASNAIQAATLKYYQRKLAQIYSKPPSAAPTNPTPQAPQYEPKVDYSKFFRDPRTAGEKGKDPKKFDYSKYVSSTSMDYSKYVQRPKIDYSKYVDLRKYVAMLDYAKYYHNSRTTG